MPLELYRFRNFDPLRRRWIVARYHAERHEIAARYEQFELIGEPWGPPNVGVSAADLQPRTSAERELPQ